MLERLPGKLMTRDNIYSMRVDNVCGCALPERVRLQPDAAGGGGPRVPGRRDTPDALPLVPLPRATQIQSHMSHASTTPWSSATRTTRPGRCARGC